MYHIPFWTFYILIHRYHGDKPFVFSTVEGRRFAIVDELVYIGPDNRDRSHIITNRDWNKDYPAVCLGRWTSGFSFGGKMQMETTFGVNGMDIVFGIRYPFTCNDCKWLRMESGSGCYDMNDEELPEYSCVKINGSYSVDQDVPDTPCCRDFYPDDDYIAQYRFMKTLPLRRYYGHKEVCERLSVFCLMLRGEWIRCREWVSP